MKLVIISDTHGKHRQLCVPEGDILIHCGDFTARETLPELPDFATWFGQHQHRHKLLICGNHDSDRVSKQRYKKLFQSQGIHYLQDEALTIGGKSFYGMPWTPEFYNWYWMQPRNSQALVNVTKAIPIDVNILITHGPPYGILDTTLSNEPVGCECLKRRLEQLNQLDLHCFGHIHEAAGHKGKSVNASVLDERYQLTNSATVIQL